MSGGSDVGSRVTDVGRLVVTARGDIQPEDLLLGEDENDRVVVRIKHLLQCARNAGEHAASRAMQEPGAAAELAHGGPSAGGPKEQTTTAAPGITHTHTHTHTHARFLSLFLAGCPVFSIQ